MGFDPSQPFTVEDAPKSTTKGFDPTKPFEVVTASEKDDLPWDVPYTSAQMRAAREQIRQGEEKIKTNEPEPGLEHLLTAPFRVAQRGGQQLLGQRPLPTGVEALEEASLGVRPSKFTSAARPPTASSPRIEPTVPGGPRLALLAPQPPSGFTLQEAGITPTLEPPPPGAPAAPRPGATLEEAGIRPTPEPPPPVPATETETVAVPQGDGTMGQVQVKTGEPPPPPGEPPTPPTTEAPIAGPATPADIRAGFPDLSDEQFEALFQQANREVPRPTTTDPADQSAWMKSLMGVMARLAVPATQPQQQTSGDPWAPVAIAPVGRPDGETPIAQATPTEATTEPTPAAPPDVAQPKPDETPQSAAVEAHGGPWAPVLDDKGEPHKNHLGDAVYENPNGVRAILDNGVPYTEATKETDKGLVPKNPGTRKRQHLTADEPWDAPAAKLVKEGEGQQRPSPSAPSGTRLDAPLRDWPQPDGPRLDETSVAPSSEWKQIGKNEEGHPLFTNSSDVHSILVDGVRHVETVRMRPTRGGMEMSVPPPAEKEPAFRPVKSEEPEAKPEPKPEAVDAAPITQKPEPESGITPTTQPPRSKQVQDNITAADRIPIKEMTEFGDQNTSPFVLPNGSVISTNGDHFSVANDAEARDAGLVRINYGDTRAGVRVLGVSLPADGTSLPDEQRRTLTRLAKARPGTEVVISQHGGGDTSVAPADLEQWLRDHYAAPTAKPEAPKKPPVRKTKPSETGQETADADKPADVAPEAPKSAPSVPAPGHSPEVALPLSAQPIPSSLDVAEQQVKGTNATLPGYDPKTGEMVDPDAVFADILANSIEDPNHVITASGLQAAAQGIYGGTLADGTLKRDRLYDAIELGVNTFITRHPERFAPTGDLASAQKAAAELAALKDRIPTQTVRAGDKVKLQQFSTPPDYAFAAVWAANIHPADVVIEPSAGTGGIAVHAMNAGARVIGNEISPQRRSMMATLPFGRITAENAEQLHNILPREIKPNVVVMNPPFSSAGDRMGGKMVIETGAVHIEQALKRLAPGGRLVAIVGDGMKPYGAETAGKGGRNNATGAAFRDWWKKIGAEYDVRANIGVGGEIYRKYGTTFPTRLLVIDKVAPRGQPPVVTTALTSAELLDALQGVRDARPGSAGEPVADQSGGSGVAQQGQGVSGSSEAVRPPTGDVGPGGEQDRPPAADSSKPTGTRGGKAGSVRTGSGQRPGGSIRSDAPAVQQPGPDPQGVAGQSGEQPVTGDVSGGSGTGGDTSHLRPDGSDLAVTAPAPELLETSIVVPEEQTGGELTESVYENYRPQRISIEGAQPHPGPLVQSAAMASVLPPLVTYKTALPKKLITEGAVSDAQLEAIVYSGNAHAQMLEKDKDGIAKRRGFFIGDGCVAAGTRIYNPLTGEHTPIEQLVDKSHVVLALTTEGFRPTVATRTFHKGVAALYCVVLDDGRSITVTGQHRFLTPDGWAKIDDGVVQIGVALACSEARPCGDASLSPIHDACDRLGSRTLQDYPGGCSDPFCDGRLPRAAGNAPKLAPSPTDVLARNHPRLRTDAWAPSPSRSGPHQSADHHSRRNWPPSESLALALNANQVHATLVLSWPGIPQNDGQSLPVIVPPLQSAASIRPRQPAPAFGWSQSLTEGECHACEADRQSLAGSCRSERQVPSNGRQSSRLGSSPGSDLRGLIPVSSAWHIITSVEPIGSHDFYDMYVPGPENYVAEGFVNHNTGVGKGREVAGIILDNKWQGRKKALWVSEKMQLANDAKRDWAGLGQNPNEILVHGKIKAGDEIKHDGILFTTYPTVASGQKFVEPKGGYKIGDRVEMFGGGTITNSRPGSGSTKGETLWTVKFDDGKVVEGTMAEINTSRPDASGGPKTRVQQIVDWVGKDFDGVIAFDEAHNMANVTGGSGTRGKKEAAAKALAGLELQNALPNARVVYVSATGATEVSNLAYADRLGLWGPGTAFADRGDFLSRVASGGVAAMELVARDMKALGYYTARSLSYDGVEYDRVQHDLTPPQRVMYDKIADAWQLVLRNMMEALKDTGADGKGGPKSAILSAFWGGHQRFFNQLITSLQMPSVIEGIDKDLAEGRQAVLQLVNTNEAGQERALLKSKERGDEDLDELDMSPRDQLLQLVDKAYPTRQYEEYLDDEGNVRVRPVSDSEGNPVHNPEAIAAKEKLLTDLGSLRVPDGPLEILVNHYGPDAVAEVTGRKQRVVERPDEAGKVKKVLEKRGTDANVAEANSFQSGKKKILIFSQAGGTGRSYHDDKTADRVDDTDRLGIGGNGARRSHYLVQAGWRADTAVQGFGRTHRTNQWTAPIFHLVTTDLEGQKRFISSIARRLGQLGALTKGERRTGDQGMFGLQDNLESDEAKAGLVQLFRDIHGGKVEGFSTDDMAEQMGLVIENDDGSLKDELPPMTQFLNRVLSLKVDDQNRVFGEFATRFRDIVDRAAEAGTLDAGTETYKADKITKARDQVVYTDPNSRAETRHVHLVTSNRNYPTSFNDLMSGQSQRAGWNAPEFFVQNKRSGYISAVTPTTFTKVDPSGIVTEHYRVSTPLDWQYVPKDDLDDSMGLEGNLTRVTNLTEARTLWDDRVVKTPEFREADLHIITGAILPIWDRLSGQPKIFRLLTDDGERLLGRVVDNKVINQTLERLGAEGVKLDIKPADVVTKILDGGVANLANGWTIKRRRVAREYRLELTGTDLYSHTAELEAAGVFRERIPGTYDTRYFIPAGETGGATIEAITKRRPIISLEGD